MKLKVYTTDGSSSQEKEFAALPVFEDGKGVQALREYLIAIQANLRQGSACAKTRAEVRGSGKKIYRQKGTGNARHGDHQAPIFVGGGVVFGPRPRDYSKKVNRKVKKLALQRALYDRAADGSFAVIESIQAAEPKTKAFASLLKRIHPEGKLLLVEEKFDDNTVRAGRNIERLHMVEADTLNPWDLVRFERIIASEKAVEKILARCANG